VRIASGIGGMKEMATQMHELTATPKILSESVSCKRLTNILNYLNFTGGFVVVSLKCLENGSRLSLRATPEPCEGNVVYLNWSENPPANMSATTYELTDFLIDKGLRVIMVSGQVIDINHSGISVVLPEHCYATSRRRMERFCAALVKATLLCEGIEMAGHLQDFGGGYLKVRLSGPDADPFLKKESKVSVQVGLRSGIATVYTGKGTIERHDTNGDNVDLLVALMPFSAEKPVDGQDAILGSELVATCRNPLSQRIIRLRLTTMSYNSFIAREHPDHITLFPGLILPEVKIDFGAGDCAQCTAQVVGGEGGSWFMSIIDMPILDQRKVFSFVEKESHMSSGVSTEIDPDDLIGFFFEAGFIYPKKYAGVANSKKHLKEMLSRLYIDAPSISQHFVQYENGVMAAHISMVRFYERSWVVHHHMAIGGMGAGSTVLSQICRYIHSYSTFPSTGMDYVIAYYRPENRFPDRVLGGLARFLNNPGLCSIDSLAYLHLHFNGNAREIETDKEWQLEQASREDLLKLEGFYDDISGGLTLKAFGLEAAYQEQEGFDLTAEFVKAGLCRQKSLFSLKNKGDLKAIMMVLNSDDGLNMSNLMKCIHIFVIDKQNLPFDQLSNQLNRLSFLYEEQEIPILIFPFSYVHDQRVNLEKVYNLLVFHVSVAKQFWEFVEQLTNRAVRKRTRSSHIGLKRSGE
jgi:hypothetical protein